MTDLLKHVKPTKDCELCDNYDTGYTCIACEGDQVKEKYPKAFTNDEGVWELMEKTMTEQTDKLKLEVEKERDTKKYTIEEIKDAVIVVTDRQRVADEVIAILDTEL